MASWSLHNVKSSVKMPALASSGKQQQCPRDRRVVVMLQRWLLLVSLAKSCVAPIPELPIPELPELPAVPVPVAAPDKLYDGPLSPFYRAFVVSSLWWEFGQFTKALPIRRRPRRRRSPRAQCCFATRRRRLGTGSARRGRRGPSKSAASRDS